MRDLGQKFQHYGNDSNKELVALLHNMRKDYRWNVEGLIDFAALK